ncbi:MAG: hypothetical protein IH987_08385 [Planctomycetes bacterium]|nr:hypothetical protein [Planctomycetota bacterium]
MMSNLPIACPNCQSRFAIAITDLKPPRPSQTVYVWCPCCGERHPVSACALAMDRQRHGNGSWTSPQPVRRRSTAKRLDVHDVA